MPVSQLRRAYQGASAARLRATDFVAARAADLILPAAGRLVVRLRDVPLTTEHEVGIRRVRCRACGTAHDQLRDDDGRWRPTGPLGPLVRRATRTPFTTSELLRRGSVW